MRLPFAVYTARQGYAWQSGTEAGTAKLDGLRKAIGKMPEFDFGDKASSGILNVGDEIVLYRFMRAEKADFKGRDAAYLALTYFNRPEARFVNAEAVLAAFPFAAPLSKPPSSFEFGGTAAEPTNFTLPTQAATGCFHPTGNLATAGFVLAQPIAGTLHIRREEPAPGHAAEFRYQPHRPPPAVKTESRPDLEITDGARPERPKHRSTVWKWVAILAIAVAIMEAALLGWLMMKKAPSGSAPPPEAPSAAKVLPEKPEATPVTENPAEAPIPETLSAKPEERKPAKDVVEWPQNEIPPEETPPHE